MGKRIREGEGEEEAREGKVVEVNRRIKREINEVYECGFRG